MKNKPSYRLTNKDKKENHQCKDIEHNSRQKMEMHQKYVTGGYVLSYPMCVATHYDALMYFWWEMMRKTT